MPCCKFYHAPGCKEGASCRYNRDSSIDRQWVHNPLPGTWVEGYRGAIVYFDQGAEIRKLSPLDGWSAVEISWLSIEFTCSQVFSILNSIGCDLNDAGGAWIITMLSPSTYVRKTQVIVENHDYANRIYNKLPGRYSHRRINAITEIMSTSDLARALHNPRPGLKHINDFPGLHDCVVCCDMATNHMRTKCGIFYCRGCWVQMCKEEAKNKGCIACYGDNCNAKFGLKEMTEMFSPATFDSVLESSLKFHLRQNPKALIECPGAECGQIYNREGQGAITCRHQYECKTPRFCTKCEDPHPGVMCEEYASDADGTRAAMEAYMKETNTKRCRHCWEAVQLSEACNHISCPCGKHWCFRCTAVFDTPDECYAHMRAEHGTDYGQVDRAPGDQAQMLDDDLHPDFGFGPPMDYGLDDLMDFPLVGDHQGGFAPMGVPPMGVPPMGFAPMAPMVPPPMGFAPVAFLAPLGLPPPELRAAAEAVMANFLPPPAMPLAAIPPQLQGGDLDQERQEQARLTVIQFEMQAHLARAEQQAIEADQAHANGIPPAHIEQEVQIAPNLRDLAGVYEYRIQRAAGLREAELELEDYRGDRDLLRDNANAIRQPGFPPQPGRARGPAPAPVHEARLTELRATMQTYIVEVCDEADRAELQANEARANPAHIHQLLDLTQNFREVADNFVFQMQIAAGLRAAEEIMARYEIIRDDFRQQANDIRQLQERAQADELAQQREEERQRQILADVELELINADILDDVGHELANANILDFDQWQAMDDAEQRDIARVFADLNVQVPDQPPRPVDNPPRRQDDTAYELPHGLPLQHNVENLPPQDENDLLQPVADGEDDVQQAQPELGRIRRLLRGLQNLVFTL